MRPLLTIASAALFTFSSETALAKQFQLFQPIGGVSAIWSPQTMRKGFSAEPRVFSARNITANVPLFRKCPGDAAGAGVQLQALWKLFRGKIHRPVAGGGNGEQERRAGAHAEDVRSIDARRGRRGWGEDIGGGCDVRVVEPDRVRRNRIGDRQRQKRNERREQT